MNVNIEQLKKMNRDELRKQVEAALTMRKAIAVRLGQPFDEVKQPGNTVVEQFLNEGRDHWARHVDGTTDELLSLLNDSQIESPQSVPTSSVEAFSRSLHQAKPNPNLKRVNEILAVEPKQPEKPTPQTSLDYFAQALKQ